MLEGIRTALALATVLGTLLLPGPGIAGQAALGTQFTMSEFYADDMSWGPGVRALLKVPFSGVTVQGTFDAFRLPCGPETCRHREVGFALLWSLPTPLAADPYLGAGVAPKLEEGWRLNWNGGKTGLFAVGGVWFGGAHSHPIRFFVEAKHVFRSSQLFVSAGFLFFLF
jgi:hypothetical protein